MEKWLRGLTLQIAEGHPEDEHCACLALNLGPSLLGIWL